MEFLACEVTAFGLQSIETEVRHGFLQHVQKNLGPDWRQR